MVQFIEERDEHNKWSIGAILAGILLMISGPFLYWQIGGNFVFGLCGTMFLLGLILLFIYPLLKNRRGYYMYPEDQQYPPQQEWRR